MGERAWVDSPLSQGTSGGVSALFDRPAWQSTLSVERDIKHRRLAPDVAAVADPFTGVRIVFDRQDAVGAGTSQAAPIWAALTVLMNQYLLGAWRTAAGQHQPAAVSGCRGCEPARVPRHQPWRERRRYLAARIRRGDGPRQPERRLLGPRPLGHPERRRSPMTAADAVMRVPVCDWTSRGRVLRDLRRALVGVTRRLAAACCDIGAYAAAPGEHVLRLSVASSLFPHLPHRSRAPFRVAMAVLFLALVAFALLRWQAPLIAVSALGLPLLFLSVSARDRHRRRSADRLADRSPQCWVSRSVWDGRC